MAKFEFKGYDSTRTDSPFLEHSDTYTTVQNETEARKQLGQPLAELAMFINEEMDGYKFIPTEEQVVSEGNTITISNLTDAQIEGIKNYNVVELALPDRDYSIYLYASASQDDEGNVAKVYNGNGSGFEQLLGFKYYGGLEEEYRKFVLYGMSTTDYQTDALKSYANKFVKVDANGKYTFVDIDTGIPTITIASSQLFDDYIQLTNEQYQVISNNIGKVVKMITNFDSIQNVFNLSLYDVGEGLIISSFTAVSSGGTINIQEFVINKSTKRMEIRFKTVEENKKEVIEIDNLTWQSSTEGKVASLDASTYQKFVDNDVFKINVTGYGNLLFTKTLMDTYDIYLSCPLGVGNSMYFCNINRQATQKSILFVPRIVPILSEETQANKVVGTDSNGQFVFKDINTEIPTLNIDASQFPYPLTNEQYNVLLNNSLVYIGNSLEETVMLASKIIDNSATMIFAINVENEYIALTINKISKTIESRDEITLQKLLTAGSGINIDGNTISANEIPTIVITEGQVISANPVQIQLTDEQYQILDNYSIVYIDATELGYESVYPFSKIAKLTFALFYGLFNNGLSYTEIEIDEDKVAYLTEIVKNYEDTSNKVTSLSSSSTDEQYPSAKSVVNYVDGYHDSTKQDVITDLATIRSGAALGATAVQPSALNSYYTKTQTDTAISNHHDSTKQDSITSSNKLSYNLLKDTPTIPTVPTNVSAFTNDSGYLTIETLPIYDGSVQ